jgi:U3 small nucleolar RNA-associated protein 11
LRSAARRHLGLLEKKKDYLLRAKDFHRKEAALRTLRRKAEERNPDEFYHAMEKARTRGGVHVAPTAEANAFSQEQLALMRTQDTGYLRHKAAVEAGKAERLAGGLHLLGAPAPERRHVVFVDDAAAARGFDPAVHFDTPAALLGRAFNRPRAAQLVDPAAAPVGAGARGAAAERRRAAAYRQLLERQGRARALGAVAAKMEMNKAVAGGGRKRKLRPEEAAGARGTFRWKAERKK